MATIKVPYSYREYSFSKLATGVDKFCHMPSRIAWIFVASMLLCFYYVACFSALPLPDGLRRSLNTLAGILVMVAFVGSLFLGLLCDKFELSKKVALWDVSGRKVTKKMKIVIAVLMVILILPGITAAGVTLVNKSQENAYHETMAVLQDPDSIAVAGNKAVASIEDRFSTLYIPEDLQTETPEEVRYIVYCSDSEQLVGYYGTSGIAGYKHCRYVKVVDRKDGSTIGSESFTGSNPPNMVSDDKAKKQYGSRPSDEEIGMWVKEILSIAG